MNQVDQPTTYTPDWAVLETGELEGSEIGALLESLIQFPEENYRARFWTMDEEGFVRILHGRITESRFSDSKGETALRSIKSLPYCRYRITRQ